MSAPKPALRLVVGLGNPGPNYAKTRHNAGFWFCAALARKLACTLSPQPRFDAIVGRDASTWLLMPQTFMNGSGAAVQPFLGYYRIAPEEMLVVHDELDLPPGQMRLKFGGGLGGHNGLKDITRLLGTEDYWRLRIGIGHPGNREDVVGYVLRAAPHEDAQRISDALARALTAWPHLADADFEAATRIINVRPKLAKPTEPSEPG